MALIKCPECNKEISDKATACPNCGYPIAKVSASGIVKIRMPRTEQIADGWIGLFSSKVVNITANGHTIWEGKHGETASFSIDAPTNVVINLGTWGNPVEGIAKPNHKYELVRDYGIHMKATFRMSEVDVIDSGV